MLDAAERNVVSIDIPTDDDPEDRPVVPGWQVPLSKFFNQRNWHAPPATYAYDFGDDWQHVVVHEGFESADDDRKYPRCIAGEGRCPPEDCGGVPGYADFLEAIRDRKHPRHEELLNWVGGGFDPDKFDPKDVVFGDPRERRKRDLEL